MGFQLDKEALRESLDACLCTDEEMQSTEKLDDRFKWWPIIDELLASGEQVWPVSWMIRWWILEW